MPAGTYDAFVWLPDTADTIRTRPEYAIKLAKPGIWEPATGYNALQTRIEVGGSRPGLATVEYGESKENLLNPERGMVGMYVSTSDSTISADTLRGYRSRDSVNLVRVVFNLKDFRDVDAIPQWYLAKMQRELDVIRDVGMKAIPRFVYDYEGSDAPNDVPFNRLSAHLDQLAPVVNRNIDVIAAVEAGLIGKYGEWWGSTSYGDERDVGSWAARIPVVQKLLDAFEDRPILMSSPAFVQYMIARGVTPESRLGMHNDAFLAGPTDWNHFPSDRDREWFEIWSLGRAVGGEHEIQPNVGWTDQDRIANYDDFARQHWSYLNPSFRREVVDLWKRTPYVDGGSYWDDILRNLGYRIKLNSVSLPYSSPVGGDIPIRITLENVGWAAPFNPREVVAVLRNTVTHVEYQFALAADPREWGRGEVTISGILHTAD